MNRKTPLESDGKIVNAREISRILGFSYKKTLSLLQNNTIPCIRVGRQFISTKSQILNWVDNSIGHSF